METYTTVILTGVAAITLAAVGLALDVYLKYKFSEDSLIYGLAHIGIIWGILVGALLVGSTFTAAVAAWLSEHKLLTVMICGSVYTASLAESYRQRSYKLTVISSLLFVGVTHYATADTPFMVLWTGLWGIIALVALIVICVKIDKAITGAEIEALKNTEDAFSSHTTPSNHSPMSPSGCRVIWRRASIPAEALTQDDTQTTEVGFQ